MTIRGICLVKNEADIIAHTLRHCARWCDEIHVLDNGSTDGTWERVHELARELPQVRPYRQAAVPFDDSLRAEVFNAERHLAQPGDWWCRLDADETYVDDPRTFLAEVPPRHHVVWSIHLQYYLTREDLPRLGNEALPEITDALLPRWYAASSSETRFFRHRPGLRWEGGAWPRHLGLATPRRIRVQHFQYRSPGQIERRLETRREAERAGWQHFAHTTQQRSWEDALASPADLHEDRGDGQFVIDEARLPHHLETARVRLAKHLLHGLGIWP